MKEKILQTSLKQFLKYGIREISIQKLIAPLGISTKTVYKYFANKEQLLEEALLLYHAQQYKLLENFAANENPMHLLFHIWYTSIDRVHKTNIVFFQDLHYYYPEVEQKIEQTISEKFVSQFRQVLFKGREEGFLMKEIRQEVMLESIFIFYDAIAKNGRFKHYRLSSFDLLLHTIAAYIRGCCTVKSIQEWDAYVQSFDPSKIDKLFKHKIAVNQ